MILAILILSILGFAISCYTYITEQKVKETPDFKAACDLSDYISCTKPMKSKYANVFFFSNAIVGMIFYVFMGLCAYFDMQFLAQLGAIGGCIVSLFLAYLLYFKIKALCILCTSLYVINALLLFFSIYR